MLSLGMGLGLTHVRHSGGAPVPPVKLRLVSPYNGFAPAAGSAAAGTQLVMLLRMPFYIGSGNVSGLVFGFDGWRMSNAGAVDLANPFTVEKVSVEKDSATESHPVLISGGRTLTVNPGDIQIKSDVLLPSAFGLSEFTKGDKYWMRVRLSVASAGLVFPRGITTHLHYGYPASLSIVVDPAVYNGNGDIDSYGPITTGSAGGWSQYPYGYIPQIMGYFASGDPKTIIGVGD